MHIILPNDIIGKLNASGGSADCWPVALAYKLLNLHDQANGQPSQIADERSEEHKTLIFNANPS